MLIYKLSLGGLHQEKEGIMKCVECGKTIKHAYYINNIAYGYNCYKQKLALIYKQWEDERNKDYSAKCFAAMQIFKSKKANSFHDSICKQWEDCKKLTAKQLDCVIEKFTPKEKIDFLCIWTQLTTEIDHNFGSIILEIIRKNDLEGEYIDNEIVNNLILHFRPYKYGFFYAKYKDKEDKNKFWICPLGKDKKKLSECLEDSEDEIIKIITKDRCDR